MNKSIVFATNRREDRAGVRGVPESVKGCRIVGPPIPSVPPRGKSSSLIVIVPDRGPIAQVFGVADLRKSELIQIIHLLEDIASRMPVSDEWEIQLLAAMKAYHLKKEVY